MTDALFLFCCCCCCCCFFCTLYLGWRAVCLAPLGARPGPEPRGGAAHGHHIYRQSIYKDITRDLVGHLVLALGTKNHKGYWLLLLVLVLALVVACFYLLSTSHALLAVGFACPFWRFGGAMLLYMCSLHAPWAPVPVGIYIYLHEPAASSS
jgi:hypothetical protein